MSDRRRSFSVSHRGRWYVVRWADCGPVVYGEFQRWRGLGAVLYSRPTKPGPTRRAVVAKAAKMAAEAARAGPDA